MRWHIFLSLLLFTGCTKSSEPFTRQLVTILDDHNKPMVNVGSIECINDSLISVVCDDQLRLFNYKTGKQNAELNIRKLDRNLIVRMCHMDSFLADRLYRQLDASHIEISKPAIRGRIAVCSPAAISMIVDVYPPSPLEEKGDTIIYSAHTQTIAVTYDYCRRVITSAVPVEDHNMDSTFSMPEIAFTAKKDSSFFFGCFTIKKRNSEREPLAISYRWIGTTYQKSKAFSLPGMTLVAGVPYKYSFSDFDGQISLAYQNSIWNLERGTRLYSLEDLPGKSKMILYHRMLGKDTAFIYYADIIAPNKSNYYLAAIKGKQTCYRQVQEGYYSAYKNKIYELQKTDKGLCLYAADL